MDLSFDLLFALSFNLSFDLSFNLLVDLSVCTHLLTHLPNMKTVAINPAMLATIRLAWHRWRKLARSEEGEGENLDFLEPEQNVHELALKIRIMMERTILKK